MIELKNVSRTFGKDTKAEVRAVKDASFTAAEGEIWNALTFCNLERAAIS
jgi:ABC-type Na+ transport system ATPase subunit NatA